MIRTKSQLKEYILSRLGSPVISVEIDDKQLDYLIEISIVKFSNFTMDGEEPTILMIPVSDNVFEYELDDRIQSVTDIRFVPSGFSYQFPGGMVVVPSDLFSKSIVPTGNMDIISAVAVLSKMSMVEHYFNIKANYHFNGTTKRLRFYENPFSLGEKALLFVYLKYEVKEVDNIYQNQWIMDYTLALAKKQWGENLGKYNSTLIGGSTINYDRMMSEGQSDIEKLDLELLSTWTKPLPILRG
jgi:hypothetical protein